ncbi:MFS transporter [Ornithinimicrobium humiphilum]|uniref:Sugar phosphate permease n=1 Tax=Ornithinimicrobium humiphilum TaxID=125288 RepID=A0A543KN51_9MICO|nr:MFS transporter [Ornithinimicrobium humiphilum]TQM96502.1 sugar phosphate permease [Ornithinimicrobium humiphilum]
MDGGTMDGTASAGTPRRHRIHPAWPVAGVTFLVLLAAAAFRSSISLLLVPIEEDLGWTRTDTSLAVSLNLVVYGLTAPFAAALLERVGVRRTAAWAMLLVALGCLGTTLIAAPWQLAALWGVVIGVGTGSVALVFGAIVANRWFVARRGLVVGVLGAAWATGQLVFLPMLAALVEALGWRAASVAIAALCALLVPVVLRVLRDRPADRGVLPYGGTAADVPAPRPTPSAAAAVGAAVRVLRETALTRPFLLLAGTFFICGWTTNGIVSSHFVPAAHDHGMGATTAAGLLAVVGIFDIVGTVGSGWLTDRFDPRLLLAVYYGLRGVALLAIPALLGPTVEPPLVVVVALFGLDWVATVPPTVVLCRTAFGSERGGIVFGWVFAAHMVGAGAAAAASGAMRAASGDYTSAWLLAGALALAAALGSLALPRPRSAVEEPAPAPV